MFFPSIFFFFPLAQPNSSQKSQISKSHSKAGECLTTIAASMIHNNQKIVGSNAEVAAGTKRVVAGEKKKVAKSNVKKSGGKLARNQPVMDLIEVEKEDVGPVVTVTKGYFFDVPLPSFRATKICMENARPIAQQQRRARLNKNMKVTYYNGSAKPAKTVKELLKQSVEAQAGIVNYREDGAVEVQFIFEFKLPDKPAGKQIGDPYDMKVDLDNLQKFMFDAMAGIFYGDDSMVCTVSAKKVYGASNGTTVYVGSLKK